MSTGVEGIEGVEGAEGEARPADASPVETAARRPKRKPVLLAAGAVIAAGLAGLYARRVLRLRARPAPDVRLPTAGRPLALVRGELDARGPIRDHEE